MKKIFSGKTAIITGGGKGIGRETARLLGRAGCNIVISGRNKEALVNTASQLQTENIAVLAVQGDVTDQKDCRNVIYEALREFGGIDFLINNAGMSMRGTFENTDLDLFTKVMDINFGGAVIMTKTALSEIKKAKGSIVFISSISGLKGLPGIAPYSAAKMALKSFSESLRAELYNKVHVGILYVSFTENDPGKTMFNEKGDLVPLHRDKNSSTQLDVAKAVLLCIRRRKRQIVMTTLGKLASFFYALLPGLTETLIAKFAAKSSLYASDNLYKNEGKK